MLEIILDVAAALLLYFIPGILLLTWVDFPSLRGLNKYLVALCLSLVLTPFAFIVVGNIVHIQAGLWSWLVLVILLGLGSLLLRRTNRRVKVQFINLGWDDPEDVNRVSRFEKWGVVIFLAVFAAVANLPRLLMFFQGSNVMELGPWDETWHIAQLVSVARSGIPPANYLFPSLHLGYYYGSVVYPAILGNLPILQVSLIRALSIHSYLQVFAFLGLIYVLLQLNFRRIWVRLVGVCFFTVMGGFDLFASLPKVDDVEWWIRFPGWLTGNETMQVSQFITLYLWVPQHLAGGMVALLLILIYKNLEMPTWLKLACTGVLFGFCITTSPFVFIGLAFGAAIIALWNWRYIWRERKTMLISIGLALILFLLVAWNPLRVYSAHNSSFTYSKFAISLVARFRGSTNLNLIIDKFLTMIGLPLVAGVMLMIDMGLMFILYIVWWLRRLFSHHAGFHTSQDILLGFQPVLSLIFVFLVTDVGGGANVAMRGLIPAQILITLAAILVVDWLADRMEGSKVKHVLFAYIFLVFLFAQSVSALAELRTTSKRVLQLSTWSECGVPAIIKGNFSQDYCLPKDPYRYVFWLNQNTPTNALVLEDGPYGTDFIKFRWLERLQLLIPKESANQSFHYYDADFILPAEWNKLLSQGNDTMDALQWYQALDFPSKGERPVYIVTRQAGQAPAGAGEPVYQDDYVKIYSLPEAVLNP